MTTVITGKDNIMKARAFILKGALKLEINGMHRRGRSVYAIVKEQFGFKGNRQEVLRQLEEYINKNL